MILVDTTVWIAYFNGYLTAETDYLDAILGEQMILVGDLILSEILQGFCRDEDFEKARAALNKFQQVAMVNPALAVQSAQNYRMLRKRGITIRKTIDCFIATYCVEFGHALLHTARDFDPFEEYLGLQVVHPGA